ncbi:hypothetical protein BsWGS_03815 [Bradybaena similaris]
MSNSKADPCQTFACALQKCLQASNYQEWKCASVMQALYDCCAKAGNDSVVCSGIHPKETASRVGPQKFTHKIVAEDVASDTLKGDT